MNATGTASDPPRRHWIPWAFVGGFLIVIAANAIMATFAIISFTGLTTSEPYTKGLRFNEEIRDAEAQARLGWHVASRFEPRGAGRGEIEVKLADRASQPLLGARVTAVFSRPVERGHDFTVALGSAGGGHYVARATFPLAGLWDVRYRIEHDGHALKAHDRLRVE